VVPNFHNQLPFNNGIATQEATQVTVVAKVELFGPWYVVVVER
jgi:hypothetical protein